MIRWNDPRIPARVWAKIDPDHKTRCWLWTGGCINGYAEFYTKGTTTLLHRVMAQIHYGPIPKGLTCTHTCYNKKCVSPFHIKYETCKERRSRAAKAQTHCKHGHEYTQANTVIKTKSNRGPFRVCLACRKRDQNTQWIRRKERLSNSVT